MDLSFDPAAQLKAQGLRVTRSAVYVLRVLHAAKHPQTHDDLMKHLNETEGSCDRVTLYRILDRMTQVGLIKKTQGFDRAWRFSLADHLSIGLFECDQCHNMEELAEDKEIPYILEQLNQRLKRQGIENPEVALSIHGTCKNCH